MAAGDLRPQTSENARGVQSLLDSLAMLVALDASLHQVLFAMICGIYFMNGSKTILLTANLM